MSEFSARRLDSIQCLRAIAVVGVLLSHLVSIEAKQGGETLLSSLYYIGMSGVDVFFVVSGFVMVHVTWGLARGPQALLPFLAARLVRIYPLYWLLTLALLPVWFMRPDMVFAGIGGEPNIVTSVLLWPDHRPPLLAVGWTLVHEMIFYIVFAFSLLFSRRKLPLFLALWALVVVAGNLYGIGGKGPVTLVLFDPMTLEFIAGAAAALLIHSGRLTEVPLTLPAAILGFGAAFWLAAPGGSSLFADHWARVTVFCVPAALLVHGVVAAELKGARFPSWAVVLGDSSYSLYLTHVLTLSAFALAWRPLSSPQLIDNLVAMPLLLAGAVGVGLLSWFLVERPLLRWRPTQPRAVSA